VAAAIIESAIRTAILDFIFIGVKTFYNYTKICAIAVDDFREFFCTSMGTSSTAVAVGLGIAAITGYAIYKAGELEATANDLKITTEGVKIKAPKKIGLFQSIAADVEIGFGNQRTGTLKLESVDLDFYIDGSRVGGVRDYGANVDIKPGALTKKIFPAKFPIASLLKAAGNQLLNALMMTEGDDVSVLQRLMPKELKTTGMIRSNGIAIKIDQVTPLTIEKKS